MQTFDIDSPDNRDPQAIARVAEILEPWLRRLFDPELRGLERIPDGPVLYVGNHNGAGMTPDTWVFLVMIYLKMGLDALPYGLGHEEALRLPVFGELAMKLGAIRAGHDNAGKIFRRGNKVLVYPGGDIDGLRPTSKRHRVVFGERRGYVRLALKEGVPVMPVVTAGAHSSFIVLNEGRWAARLTGVDRLFRLNALPATISLPWGLLLCPPPFYVPVPSKIIVEVLEPIHFERNGAAAAEDAEYVEACHRRVHAAMEGCLGRLGAELKHKSRLERALSRLFGG